MSLRSGPQLSRKFYQNTAWRDCARDVQKYYLQGAITYVREIQFNYALYNRSEVNRYLRFIVLEIERWF